MSDPEQPEEQAPAPLLAALLQLLRLRGSPSDLPVSVATLSWLLLVDMAISAFYPTQTEQSVLPLVILALALQLFLTWLLLRQLSKSARFVQTATALIGVDVLLTMVLLPLAAYAGQFIGVEPVTPAAQFAFTLQLIGAVWSLMVFGHIYRCALDFPMLGGILVALGLMIAQLNIGQWLLGASP